MFGIGSSISFVEMVDAVESQELSKLTKCASRSVMNFFGIPEGCVTLQQLVHFRKGVTDAFEDDCFSFSRLHYGVNFLCHLENLLYPLGHYFAMAAKHRSLVLYPNNIQWRL